jgi:lysophospholipase L1-like esterase
VPGDYDGDGITDLAVYQRSTGNWLIRRSRDGSVYTVNWGWSEARPVPADYDGDGVTDVAVFHRATANWYIFGSRDGYMLKQWGWSQARPVPADYDGDRKADFAVYHPASGNWHVLGSASGQMYTVNWGFLQARPAPSDYDGDGRADIAVYHRDAGKWYIFRSHTADIRTEAFGSADMCAIPSYMNGGIQNLIILAFGDSITYGYSSSSGGPATGYPILMERICEPSLGGHCVVINGGKSGESTGDGRSRIRSLLSAHKPDLTLIMEGTNDEFFKVPYNTTESNLRSMVGSAKSAGSSVIISTIPPVIKSAYRDRTEQERLIEGFNPRISKIASSTDIQWVDTWKAITSVSNWQKDLMDQKTANHPNDAGYKVVRDTFFGGVKKGISSGLYY